MRTPQLSFIILLIYMLGGCAGLHESEDSETSAARLYAKAKASLDKRDYETAIEDLENLETRYPFGTYAQQAQLDIAYAHYKFDDPESAIAAADRFIKTYPRHPHVDYAYYLRGLASFSQISSAFDKRLNFDPAQRDPRPARRAFQYFNALVKRFPESKYANDAIKRMIYLRNFLARHEIYVAQYYLDMGADVAAANRAKYVLETYPRTPSVADALKIMAKAYTQLGIEDLASDVIRVLKLNRIAQPAPGENNSIHELN